MTAAEQPAVRLPFRRDLPIEAARQRVAELRQALADGTATFGPSMEPCTCGAPRHVHEGEQRTGKHKDSGCHRYRRELVDLLVEKALAGDRQTISQDLRAVDRDRRAKRAKKPRKGLSVRVSDAGECRRAVWYRNIPPPGFRPNATNRDAAILGEILHAGIQERRKARYPWRVYEQTLRLAGLDSEIRLDEYDPITMTVRDLKSASDGMYRVVGDDGPPESKWAQVMLYALALERAGYPVQTVALDYMRRSDGKAETHYRPYDRDAALVALDALLDLLTALEHGEEQPRDRSGPSTDIVCRSYCPARDHCWGVAAAAKHGRTPESWTRLGPDPQDDVIAALLGAYDARRAEEKAAENAKQAVAADLGGVDPGEYGDYRLDWRTSWKSDLAAFSEQLLDELAKDPDERMAPEAARQLRPPKKPSERIDVSKVRKAERDKRAAEQIGGAA